MPPLFLDISHILRIHLSMIERYGGKASMAEVAEFFRERAH